MNLTTRMTDERDWEECAGQLQDGFLYNPSERACLPPFWQQMQGRGRLNSALLEDRDQHPGRRILQFGTSVFVSDSFMREAQAADTPGLSRRVMELVWRGRSPLLDADAIRDGNSGPGLNLVVLHLGLATTGLSAAERPVAFAKMPESFMWLHEGYRLRAMLLELFDDSAIQFTRAAGFQVRERPMTCPPPTPGLPPHSRRPHLFGITREEALAQPGSYIARLFPYTPPRLFFKTGEQQLLQRALLGETDAEIALRLTISPDTVKTRWRTIFERVASRAPDLLPSPDTGPAAPRRGTEKRGPLLRYLRDHPEELRPARPPLDK